MHRSRWLLATLFLLLAAPALADRVQIYSIRGADCEDCSKPIAREIRKVKGVRKAEFDRDKVEFKVTLADGVTDAPIVAAVERAGFKALVGPGQGVYLPPQAFPAGADVVVLTDKGGDVGPLEKLRVPGKYTVFDVYADWCGPCRLVDAHLREIVGARRNVAVRKLNLVSFDTPLARRLGPSLKALPHIVVFAPNGRRTEISGADLKRLDAALGKS